MSLQATESRRTCSAAFTLMELLVVIAVIGILASLLFSSLAGAQAKAAGLACLNNVRQLGLAWLMYADEQGNRLAYNLGGDAQRKTVAPRNELNWVNGVMTWELDSDNTNRVLLLEASLAPYANNNARIYRCPSDQALSDIQRQAGWRERTRSYSMNAMVGDAGDLSLTGTNANNPGYKQFFTLTEIPAPSTIFVFLDEHPDSINDGYFLVKPAYYAQAEWVDLPGSYHAGRAALCFADGHAELHKWKERETRAPAQPDAAALPRPISPSDRDDFDWLLQRSSIKQ